MSEDELVVVVDEPVDLSGDVLTTVLLHLSAELGYMRINELAGFKAVATSWRTAMRMLMSTAEYQISCPLKSLIKTDAPVEIVRRRLAAVPDDAKVAIEDLVRIYPSFVQSGIYLRAIVAANPKAIEYAAERLRRSTGFITYPTLLHHALPSKPSADFIRAVHEVMPDAISKPGRGRRSCLHLAVEVGVSSDVIAAMIDLRPEGLQHVGITDKELPLHAAARCATSADVVHVLLKADPNAAKVRCSGRQLPLHLACMFIRPLDVIDALIEAYPEAVRETSGTENKLPLHHLVDAVYTKSPDLLREAATLWTSGKHDEMKDDPPPGWHAITHRLMSLYPPSAAWPIESLIRLRTLGEAALLEKLNEDPSCAEPVEIGRGTPFHLANFIGASEEVFQALLTAYPAAGNLKIM